MKKVIVIGGGAGGMFAALFAAQQGADVLILEKKDRLGRKMLISGKGRCNITNSAELQELLQAFGKNGRFLNSAFYTFSNVDVMVFFEKLGVPVKVERGGRVFPVSDKAQDVVQALEKALLKNNVNIKYNSSVTAIKRKDNIFAVSCEGNHTYPADAVIIATGGATYPGTGSTGDGYKFAKTLGHSLVPLLPSLVPIETVEAWPASIMGLTLKNVELTAYVDNKKIAQEFGELLFTHFGISGPIVLSISKNLTAYRDKKIMLSLNLKPALEAEKLNSRLLRDFEKYSNKDLKNAFDDLLPQNLIPIVIDISGINPIKKVHSITKEERLRLVKSLQEIPLTVKSFRPLAEAIVTSGGVKLSEVNPKTMESKIVSGLYFAGEVLDIDAVTGGYNLQAAFSTGCVAGKSAAESE